MNSTVMLYLFLKQCFLLPVFHYLYYILSIFLGGFLS